MDGLITPLDLRPATGRLGDLVANVADEQLDDPTPCGAYTVGDLVDHIGSFARAFAAAARRDEVAPGRPGSATNLSGDWRARVPADLEALAEAWAEPAAWEGELELGFPLPADVAGLVSLDETIVHGWDLARATGQPFAAEGRDLELLERLLTEVTGPGDGLLRDAVFPPPVEVEDRAPLLERVVALTGRDPTWTAP